MDFAKICMILMVFPLCTNCSAPSLDDLNKFLGYEIEFRTNRNLAERQSADVFWAKPKTVAQIKQLVKAANEFGLTVRPAGNKHSWSSLYADSGNIGLDLTLLEGNKFTLDKDRKLASCLGSGTISEFVDFTKKHGLTIPSAPSVPDGTFGGITATSAQGAIIKDGITATYVYAIDLVDGQGRERHFNEDDDKDVIAACRVHLGMCGIIYNVTVKVVPDTIFKFTKFFVKVQDFVFKQDNMKDLVMNNDGIFIIWMPFNGATDEETSARDADEMLRPPETWTPMNDLLEIWVWTEDDGSTTNTSEEFVETYRLKDNSGHEATSDYRKRSDTIFFPFDGLHFRWVTAWMGAETEDFSASKKMLKNYFEVIEKALKKHGMKYETQYGFLKWITHKEDCTLCHSKMAGDFKLVLDFEWADSSTTFNETEEQIQDQQMRSEIMTGLMSKDVLPNWAKMHGYVPGMYDHVRNIYKSNFKDFINNRNKNSLDPNNIFVNSMLKTLFQDVIENREATKSEL